jgi:hypothetical protein
MVSFTMTRWQIAIAFYALFAVILLVWRPALMFDAAGSPKTWGPALTEETSPFSIMIVFPILGILCFYVACLLDVMFG